MHAKDELSISTPEQVLAISVSESEVKYQFWKILRFQNLTNFRNFCPKFCM